MSLVSFVQCYYKSIIAPQLSNYRLTTRYRSYICEEREGNKPAVSRLRPQEGQEVWNETALEMCAPWFPWTDSHHQRFSRKWNSTGCPLQRSRPLCRCNSIPYH